MKKILAFIILALFIPLIINAETCDNDKITLELLANETHYEGNVTVKSDPVINGKNIKTLSFSEISKHIGYIPQSHVPSFPFKVLDVVLMGRAPYLNLTDSPKKEDVEIAINALKTLDIEYLKVAVEH